VKSGAASLGVTQGRKSVELPPVFSVSISVALADQPIAGVNTAVPMITKGGLNSANQKPRHRVCQGWYSLQRVAPRRINDPRCIMTDRNTGQPRGFGFVEMASGTDADKAIPALNGTLLDERALIVNEARPKKQLGSFRDRDSRSRGAGRW
jgi:hypothetical protein